MISIPYGKQYINWESPEGIQLEVLRPKEVSGVKDPKEEVRRAVENPLGSKKISELGEIKKVSIAVADLTRPVPNKLILPILITELEKIGVKPENITVIIGTGLHRVSPQSEFKDIVGEELLKKINVVSHDAYDNSMQVNIGVTSRGTPVDINKYFANADLKIVVGMIDPHQFQGYTGGAKGLAIGLGGKSLITANHSMLTNKDCRLGKVIDNPAREDIDEIGKMAKIDFVINVVLNEQKEIVRAFAGDASMVHCEGVKLAREIFEVKVHEEKDIVIASPGGFPKDLNVYQAQKGLAHAAMVVKNKGFIILVAECREGMGDDKFYEFLAQYSTPGEVIESFTNREFEMGANKAFLWCRSLEKAQTILVSDKIDKKIADTLMVQKCNTIDEAFEIARRSLGHSILKVALMPKASSTIPVLKKSV